VKALKHFVELLWDFIWHIVVLLLLLLLGFHFWFLHHSESAIGELITWRSNGKIKCTFDKVSINYLNNDLEVRDIVLFNTDSVFQATSYRFGAKNFHLKIHSKWDLLFHKRLVIDAITFNAPSITISQKGYETEKKANTNLGLTRDVGKLYRTILRSLRMLKLQLFEIKDGRLQINETGNDKGIPLEIKHINLTINALQIDSASLKNTDRSIFSERVRLRLAGQHIELPGRGSVSFEEILIDSKDKFVRVISPNIKIPSRQGERNSFAFFAKAIQVTGLDFNELYRRQLIRADSVFVDRLSSSYDIFGGVPKNKNGLQASPLTAMLNRISLGFEIRNITLSKCNAAIQLHLGSKVTSLSTRNDDVHISDFHLNDSIPKKLTIKGFNYTVRNYVGYTPDSLMRLTFDSLQFDDSKVILYNLAAATTPAAVVQRTYKMPRAELTGSDWISFVFQNKLKARSAVLFEPVLHLTKNTTMGEEPVSAKANGQPVYQSLSMLDKVLKLDRLRIVSGSLSYQNSGKLQVSVHQFNLDLDVKRLEKASSQAQLISSLNHMSFGSANVVASGTTVKVEQGTLNSQQMKLTLGKLQINADSGHTFVSLNGISLDHPAFEQNRFTANDIFWNEGDIQIKAGHDSRADSTSSNELSVIALDHISAKNTRVRFDNKNLNAEAFTKTISAKHFRKASGKPVEWDSLQVAGRDLLLRSAALRLQCADFSLRDGQSSVLHNAGFQQFERGDSLLARIPALKFTPFIRQSLKSKKLIINGIDISQPEIVYSASRAATANNRKPQTAVFPDFQLAAIRVDNASMKLRVKATSSKVTGLSLKINSITARRNSALVVDHAQLSAGELLFAPDPNDTVKAHGHLLAGFDSFTFHPQAKAWEAQLNHFQADDIVYVKTQPAHGTISLSADQVAISGAKASSKDFKDLLPWLVGRSGLVINVKSARWRTVGNDLTVSNLAFNQMKKQASLSSFRLDPRKNRDEFYRDLIYRKDYIHAGSGSIRLEGIGMADDQLEISNMDISSPLLSIFSNKFKKSGKDTEQPLPVAALGKITLPFKIRNTKIENGTIRYTELNAVSRDTGQVYFTGIHALIGNLATRRTAARDSLTALVKASFLGKMPLRVTMDQSYRDVNDGLKLTIQLGHGKADLLNSFLPQLVSMQARSGYVDTMFMSAEANKYRTHGTMHLYFRDLRANLLDSGNVKRQKLSTKLTTFLFNSFALKSSNQNKGVKFYFIRDSTESTIDYFLQMIVEGTASSVIPATRRIYRKEYDKAQEAIALSSENKH